jgi:DNA polymerase III beta subunit, central domain
MKIEISCSILATALEFAATKDVRYYFCAVHIRVDGGNASIEATNGHVLAVVRLPSPGTLPDGSYLIPRESITSIIKAIKLPKLDPTIEVTFTQDPPNNGEPGKRRFTLSVFGQSVSGDLVDGRYPDVARLTAPAFDKTRAMPVLAQIQPAYAKAVMVAYASVGGITRAKSAEYPMPQYPRAYQLIPLGVETIREGETLQTANRRLMDTMLNESVYAVVGEWRITVMPLRLVRGIVLDTYQRG